ncbi:ATP-dependent DNA helicase [Flavobacteriales bacterium]|nr:ATP-dependent DNA helicase [Flavobacteriales bacterium]
METPVDPFVNADSLVGASIHEGLERFFGFNQFKGEQEEVVTSLMAGKNAFVIMPTGGGKSLCYQLPALIQEGTAIVVSPLIALMKNQVDAIRSHSDDPDIAHFLNSSLSKLEMARVKEAVATGRTKLLYVAPESLNKTENADFLRSVRLSFFAIDEAHCISEWGHDFRPEYRRLKEIIDGIGQFPIIALTATATPKVQHDIQKNLGILEADVFKASFNRPNLFYEVRPKVDALKQVVQHALENRGRSGIVYCLSRKKVEEIADTLKVNGVRAAAYHAGMDSSQRSRRQDQFLMQDVDVIVATIAFGMGIDKPDVRFVIHYDMPKSLEAYYQETGRAGRDGGEGHCIAFYGLQDMEKLEKFLSGKAIAEREIGMQLLQEVSGYAETPTSRRKYILHYFGEEFDEKNGPGWDMDDNARNPPEPYAGKDIAVHLLNLVKATGGRHRAGFLRDVLLGNETQETSTYAGEKVADFNGSGEKLAPAEAWDGIIRQIVLAGFLSKKTEEFGVLSLTEAGVAFMESPSDFTLYKDKGIRVRSVEPEASGVALDQPLLDMLQSLRKSEADRLTLPPFVIFSDPSLEEMATHYPCKEDELLMINGVGASKVRKFGAPFIALIQKHIETEGIERMSDLVVRSVAGRNAGKVNIIQKLDRRMSLEDIANAQKCTVDELLDSIEGIVASGTKVGLDYVIEEYLDEDSIEELWECFMESAEGTVAEVMEEMEDAYSEEEVRLVRIKFMSEVAN